MKRLIVILFFAAYIDNGHTADLPDVKRAAATGGGSAPAPLMLISATPPMVNATAESDSKQGVAAVTTGGSAALTPLKPAGTATAVSNFATAAAGDDIDPEAAKIIATMQASDIGSYGEVTGRRWGFHLKLLSEKQQFLNKGIVALHRQILPIQIRVQALKAKDPSTKFNLILGATEFEKDRFKHLGFNVFLDKRMGCGMGCEGHKLPPGEWDIKADFNHEYTMQYMGFIFENTFDGIYVDQAVWKYAGWTVKIVEALNTMLKPGGSLVFTPRVHDEPGRLWFSDPQGNFEDSKALLLIYQNKAKWAEKKTEILRKMKEAAYKHFRDRSNETETVSSFSSWVHLPDNMYDTALKALADELVEDSWQTFCFPQLCNTMEKYFDGTIRVSRQPFPFPLAKLYLHNRYYYSEDGTQKEHDFIVATKPTKPQGTK